VIIAGQVEGEAQRAEPFDKPSIALAELASEAPSAEIACPGPTAVGFLKMDMKAVMARLGKAYHARNTGRDGVGRACHQRFAHRAAITLYIVDRAHLWRQSREAVTHHPFI
jgi:hypothetical protein